MKNLAQEIRDLINRLEGLIQESVDSDDELGHAAKMRLTRQAAASLSVLIDLLSQHGKLVKHPKALDTIVFVPNKPNLDSGNFVRYFEKLTDEIESQLGFEPFLDFNLVAASAFADLPSIAVQAKP